MSRFVVSGGNKLCGCAEIQGSKNSALPLMAAAVLTDGESVLFNCPDLSDVDASMRILRYLGCEAYRESDAVVINSSRVCRGDIPDDLMREMRSSIVFLGAVLSRCKRAVLTFPGGCELGPRPIDMHLKALRKLGARIIERYGVIECTAEKGLKGARIALS
ncbi:MAG: UDP-N-acetylglucosamine 1-carboxyvinyltransferase, partial [Ruminococcus sp.]|nr:UDP-N-acetylglucosamine 1-carboxyvinyltransferase [Ruminococcus sp.]